MSMEINSHYMDYRFENKFSNNNSPERLQEESRDRAEEAGKEHDVRNRQSAGNKSEGIPIPKDEYIRSEQSGRRVSGLYRMAQDENGNSKVLYEDPKKTVNL